MEIQNKQKKPKKEKEDDSKATPTKPKPKSKGGDPSLRAKVVDFLKEALGPKLAEDPTDPEEIARQIEEAMFDLFQNTEKDYKAKYRSLSFNLKKNVELRNGLMIGALTPAKLCTMTPLEMASEDLKKELHRIEQYYLEAAKLLGNKNQTTTDMFRCGKCGERKTTYYQMQTRSADEPMTTFHTCCVCGNRWKS